ncbi:MAG: InlB B-repeat-containing protein [Bacilli bacterium]|nr:InlB B-repeat-containing protein [Bacilli bacterium]
MNKKGFTLIELLATIVVLALIFSIAIYITTNVIGKSKRNSYKVTINEIEDNAGDYLAENSRRLYFIMSSDNKYEYQCITIENLVDYGYLDKDIVNSNTSNNSKVSLSDYIYIERDPKTKAITKSMYVDTKKYREICGKAVIAMGSINFISSPDFDKWSKSKNITINYKLKNLNDERTFDEYKYNYKFVGLDGTVLLDKTFKGDTIELTSRKINITTNGELTANIKLDNNTIVTASKTIDKIDTTGPVIEMGSYTGNTTIRSSVTIPLKVTDIGSGVDHTSFVKDDIDVMVGDTKVSDYSLSKVNDTDYKLAINSDLYNGKVVLTIEENKVLDKIKNGNLKININTGITFSNVYKITYDANKGTNAPTPTTYTYATSGTVSLSSSKPTRNGYTFWGWSTSSSATDATYAAGGNYNKNIKNDVTLYAVWRILKWEYEYTGNIQGLTIPYSGTFKLEVWGASGAKGGNGSGGKGGYATGTVYLAAGTKIYIGVGGSPTSATGGYNGGGRSYSGGGAGGGATHIAKNNNRGVLANYASYTSEILIVAGGGGGGARDTISSDVYDDGANYYNMAHNGGAGGGSSGGDGAGCTTPGRGGKSPKSCSNCNFGSFGQGGNATNPGAEATAGGGGGYYGGDSGSHTRSNSGGGGGSGYVGGVSGGSMQSGTRSGHGFARITFVS